MSEIAEARQKAVMAAVAKMNEGLQDYLNAVADEGEPEAPISAIMLFESRGMNDKGLFGRVSHIFVEQSNVTSMLGLLDLAGNNAHDVLTAAWAE